MRDGMHHDMHDGPLSSGRVCHCHGCAIFLFQTTECGRYHIFGFITGNTIGGT
jgi:hypothetical protein